ncbi:pyruvate dehydrogenase (acetyl-transferring) E1 component subunit alpha [Actomonas aquatica]|uniref:Pyruvate dehydrogenase E1 component subunit alpha n=1 Tax=Actomonas aquatica TaxID=2866162 RepID=A0ABZ1CBN3_9BACT|nr:pyruvate dehydrogenase (acetyl-transferring) E1 component subunit alpha [Opitutus sp. WL0086]WRQ87720.1 pyruvate dehydrogenase (acetyl-transferring) E1 component subunit alpha [Opitutus sp. WL0086]
MSKETPTTTITDAAKAAINAQLSADEKIELYRKMVRIRRFEERSLRAYQSKKIGGFLHLYIGQEAVAVGACSLMGEHDHVITAYRDHGHAIAVGMETGPLMAELYGKVTGCSKGKGGSMHYFAPDKNYWGGHGIVGGQIPLGTGLAYGVKYQGKKGSAMAFMGDGAVNQGAVHEAMNLAGLWDLPCVFVIENNRYSMGTSQIRSSAGPGLAERAAGYGIHWAKCLGHDVYEVRACLNDCLELARNESKPSVVEIDTYRYRGHSVADPDKTYRTRDEIDEYRKNKDPIAVFQRELSDEGVLNEDLIKEIDTAAREEAEKAATFAEESPFPTPADIQRDVYWETDHPEQRTSKGRLFFS